MSGLSVALRWRCTGFSCWENVFLVLFVCFKSSVLKDSFGPKHLLLFTIEPLFQESFVWTASKGLWVGHEDRVDHPVFRSKFCV